MGQIARELFGRLFEYALGCDGVAAMTLLMGAMWFGHYSFKASGSRSWERLILMPLSIACFIVAALVCSFVKFLILASLCVLAYLVSFKTPGPANVSENDRRT